MLLFFGDTFLLRRFEPWFFGPQSCLNFYDRPIWLFIKFVIESIRKARTVSGSPTGGLRAAVAAVVGHFTFPLFYARICGICGWPFEPLIKERSTDCCIAFSPDDIWSRIPIQSLVCLPCMRTPPVSPSFTLCTLLMASQCAYTEMCVGWAWFWSNIHICTHFKVLLCCQSSVDSQ